MSQDSSNRRVRLKEVWQRLSFSKRTFYRRVAARRLSAIPEEREHEHEGILAPKTQRVAALEPI
jgi:predicted DNA-binding transcriptional regulator YafY